MPATPSEPDGPAAAGGRIGVVAVRPRRRIGIGLGAALVLAGVAVAAALLSASAASAGATRVSGPESDVTGEAAVTAPSGVAAPPLFVHVLGAVNAPGLYQLSPGARVVDAVAAAAGLTEDAEVGAVNLARPIVDGEQLAVPRIGEQAPLPAGASAGLVDLNTATASELDALPRIGPVTAQRIIAWREQGNHFSSADDLLEISGVGEKTVEGLRGLVAP